MRYVAKLPLTQFLFNLQHLMKGKWKTRSLIVIDLTNGMVDSEVLTIEFQGITHFLGRSRQCERPESEVFVDYKKFIV